MSLDKRLLDILCCPETKQPVALASARQLTALNEAQAAGRLLQVDGSAVVAPLAAGLVTADGRRVYRIDDGIPVMLVDQAIETRQIADFPR
jgi:uncharacterized protein